MAFSFDSERRFDRVDIPITIDALTKVVAGRKALPLSLSASIVVVAVLLAFVLAVLVRPTAAFADYTIPQVSIDAQAQRNGSLHIQEQRTFDFNGTYSAVWWDLGDLPAGADVVVHSVFLTPVSSDETHSETREIDSVPFRSMWRYSGGPDKEAFSYDRDEATIYVFFNVNSEKYQVTIDYSIYNCLNVYSDVGEVYWKFVGPAWEVDSENVTLDLRLPAPEGEAVVPGDTVRAWGHGPLDATLEVSNDASVKFSIPKVKSGSFAEARVIFPASWLSSISDSSLQAHRDKEALAEIIAEEEKWAEQANQERLLAIAPFVIYGLVCLIAVAILLWVYFRYGKEYKPQFTEQYWRDVPDKNIHPAVIAYLWNRAPNCCNDLPATLMYLTCKGAVRLEKAPECSGEQEGYLLTRLPAADQLENPLDKKALEIMFETVGGGAASVQFNQLTSFGADHPQKCQDAFDEWEALLEAEVEKQDLFEQEGVRWEKRLAVITGLIGLIGWLVVTGLTRSLIPTVIGVLLFLLFAGLSGHMQRRTIKGNEIYAKCKALRNWLKDFSALDERPPTDLAVWGEFMVYAYIFGVATEVVEQLRLEMPNLEDENWYPWFYMSGFTLDTEAPIYSLQTMMANTASEVTAALNPSSGSGSGGGFSGGGGGGFGGGGGGAR